jgi:hypothetical protein
MQIAAECVEKTEAPSSCMKPMASLPYRCMKGKQMTLPKK